MWSIRASQRMIICHFPWKPISVTSSDENVTQPVLQAFLNYINVLCVAERESKLETKTA